MHLAGTKPKPMESQKEKKDWFKGPPTSPGPKLEGVPP